MYPRSWAFRISGALRLRCWYEGSDYFWLRHKVRNSTRQCDNVVLRVQVDIFSLDGPPKAPYTDIVKAERDCRTAKRHFAVLEDVPVTNLDAKSPETRHKVNYPKRIASSTQGFPPDPDEFPAKLKSWIEEFEQED